jgi:transcriptional regulator with XRE-family HTH domain
MQTIGERFEEARKRKGVSLREAAEATKIRGDYLQRFEGNQFDIDLADIYVKGFLRSYSSYLKLPGDRIVADYTALGHREAGPRQPSREVYGRMDLSVATADERAETSPVAPPPAIEPRIPRGRTNLPASPLIQPALIFRGGIAVAVALVALLAFWAVRSLLSDSPAAPPAAAAAATPAAPDAVVSIVALDPVRIKVVRQSDGAELYQGPLERGEHRDYPNVPLYLTSNALESVEIVYKGKHYSTGQKGWSKVALDFSNR